MKKSMIFLGCIALLMAGCNKIETVEEPAAEIPDHLIVDIKVGHEGETRSIKKTWEAGDKIYVAFDYYFTDDVDTPTSETVYYMILTYNGFSWDSSFSDNALEQYLLGRTSGLLAAAYCSDFVPQFEYQRGNAARKTYSLKAVNSASFSGFFIFANNVPYSVTNGKLTATLELSAYPNDVYFFIDVPGVAPDRLSLSCENFTTERFAGFIRYRTSDTDEGYPAANYSRLTVYGGALYAGQRPGRSEKYFCGYLKNNLKDVETEYVIKITDNMGTPDDDTDDTIYTLTKTDKLSGKIAIELPPLSDPKWVKTWTVNSGTVDGHEWVRMGDGLKWATKNPLSSDETDPGYFYTWEHAKSPVFTEFMNPWRLPTEDEWSSLASNSYHTFENVYRESDGIFIGLRVHASNTGNVLYLPVNGAADPNGDPLMGGHYDPVTFEWIPEVNPYGFYWTSYYNATNQKASYAFITDDDNPPVSIWAQDPNYLMLVRYILDE